MNLKPMKEARGGDWMHWQDINMVAAIGGVLTTLYGVWVIRSQQKTIEAQQITIQKLLNREPVSYKEVNAKPPKPDTDRPIAWGGIIADRDEL